ncbi:MAG: PaaI family thioesterase [Chloroflexi bacterium]|nr:PaaI family thioesterase [Chloroflexota bacterium]
MSTSKQERIRTVTWEDPAISARDAQSIGGLEYLRSIKEGKIKPPPAAMLIGYRPSEVEVGRVVFELEPAEYHYNPFASVHGGVAGILLDSAMTAAILTTLPAGVTCSTLEMKVNYIRPMTDRTGLVRCEAKTIHVGSRIATAEGRITDLKGKLYAHGVNTCVILAVRKET